MQTKVLLDLTSSMQPQDIKSPTLQSPGPKSSEAMSSDRQAGSATESAPRPSYSMDQKPETLDLSALLGQAVDTAQIQISRVLKVRNEQTTHLDRIRFLRYFLLNKLFADECEAVSGRGGQTLKGIINAQISGFVQGLTSAETDRIASLLDKDSWNAHDFTEDSKILLERIVAAIDVDPPEWSQFPPLWDDINVTSISSKVVNGGAHTNGTASPAPARDQHIPQPKPGTAKAAYIDDHRHFLVESVSALLPVIDTFLALTTSLPSMTPQISTGLLEVLRTFNSRSCQLILGAGATRSAGLKNITTKHLALASQALSFIIALVPYIREAVRRHLPANQAQVLAEFDKTKRLLQEHQAGIHEKLVDIMMSRSQAHVKALMSTDLSNADVSPSPYMETLTKETLTLYRVLSRYLSAVDVGIIMRQIAAAYNEQWTKAFMDAETKDQQSEQALLKDAEAFDARFGKLEGFDDVVKNVLGVVKTRVDNEGNEGPTESNTARDDGKEEIPNVSR